MERDRHPVVERARLALGTRFRPQGRSIEDGLDCVGLAALAFGVAEADVPRDYAMRGTKPGTLARLLSAHGLAAVEDGDLRAGDLAVFEPGPRQVHLAIVAGATLIHADMGLRRIVERPLPAPWPLAGLWRLRAEGEQG
ncbi:MAG TPA: peptidoglycan endopeptidase [Allosphingosinicella sp.]|jgi:cell wall-associated NlpC family hydrolase